MPLRPIEASKKKESRWGTWAGSIVIYCAQGAIADANLNLSCCDKSKIGVYLGITEHGTVETENEIYEIKQFDYIEGDPVECQAIREDFGEYPHAYINNTKSFIGHTIGAAGALKLAGNLPSSEDYIVHSTINLDHLDPECPLNNLVINEPKKIDKGRSYIE